MRTVYLLFVVFAATPVISAAAEPAPAKPKRIGASKPPTKFHVQQLDDVVTEAAVETELNLTDLQKSQIREFKKQFVEAGEKLRASMIERREEAAATAPVTPEQLAQEGSEYSVARSEAQRGLSAEIFKKLTPEQRARLAQIHLQVEGPYAFLRPELCRRLTLDPGQVEAIKEAIAQSRHEAKDVYVAQSPVGAPGKNEFDRVAGSRDRALLDVENRLMGTVRSILNRTERYRYSQMLGKPFEPSSPDKR